MGNEFYEIAIIIAGYVSWNREKQGLPYQ